MYYYSTRHKDVGKMNEATAMMFSDLIDEFPREMREPMYRLMNRLFDHVSNSPTKTDFQRERSG